MLAWSLRVVMFAIFAQSRFLEPCEGREREGGRGAGGVPVATLRREECCVSLVLPVVSASPAGDRGPHRRIRPRWTTLFIRHDRDDILLPQTECRAGSLPADVTSCFPADGTVGTSEARGVSWHKSTAKWQARLQHGGKQHFLGLFAEERDAIDAVRAGRGTQIEARASGSSILCTDP